MFTVNTMLAVTGDFSYKESIQREALKRNMQVDYVMTMEEALNMLIEKEYVLVVIRADTVNYLPLLKVMKKLQPVPVLVFSYSESTDKVTPLKMGADVYIVTPYEFDYIIESGHALAQLYTSTTGRYKSKQPAFLTYEYVRVCVDSRQAFIKGKLIDLTKKEFDILCLLMQNQGDVLTYREIFRQIWGEEYVDSSINILTSAVHRLKQKLSIEPGTAGYIKNKHQLGYTFDPN